MSNSQQNSQSTRRTVLRMAGAALAGVDAASGQSPTFRFNGKQLYSDDLQRALRAWGVESACYLPVGPTVHVYRSESEMMAEVKGSSMEPDLARLNEKAAKVRELKSRTTDSHIQGMRRAMSFVTQEIAIAATADGTPIEPDPLRPLDQAVGLVPLLGAIGWDGRAFTGAAIPLFITVPDLGWFNWNNRISSVAISGIGMLCDLPWLAGSKFYMGGFLNQAFPDLGAFRTPHGVSWDNLASSYLGL